MMTTNILVRVIRKLCSTTTSITVTPQVSKTAIFDKVKGYWKDLGSQYWDTLKEIKDDSIKYPVRATCYVLSLSGLGYCCFKNPDEADFHDELVKCMNKTLTVNKSLLRKESFDHVIMLSEAYSTDRIRYSNFGLFSIIWTDRYSRTNRFYESQSRYFTVNWSNFCDEIVDFGFLNRWWMLGEKMLNYDDPSDDLVKSTFWQIMKSCK